MPSRRQTGIYVYIVGMRIFGIPLISCKFQSSPCIPFAPAVKHVETKTSQRPSTFNIIRTVPTFLALTALAYIKNLRRSFHACLVALDSNILDLDKLPGCLESHPIFLRFRSWVFLRCLVAYSTAHALSELSLHTDYLLHIFHLIAGLLIRVCCRVLS